MFHGLVSQQSVLKKPTDAHWSANEDGEMERSIDVLSLAIEGLRMVMCGGLVVGDVV